MNKQQSLQFLNEIDRNYDNNKLFSYDKNNNGYLSFDNFMNYFVDKINIDSKIVWYELNKLGYNCNIDDECLNIFANLTANDTLFMPSGLFNLAKHKKLVQFLEDNKIITFMVCKIVINKKTFGYIVLFEDKITRIWQEKEAAVCLYLNKVIELLYHK